ncbi:unnamed protein product [Rhizopus stolonifer]
MSATEQEVENLKKKVQEYEKSEKKWRDEHKQLVDLQKKITQAGNHMRTLTNESIHSLNQLQMRNNKKNNSMTSGKLNGIMQKRVIKKS